MQRRGAAYALGRREKSRSARGTTAILVKMIDYLSDLSYLTPCDSNAFHGFLLSPVCALNWARNGEADDETKLPAPTSNLVLARAHTLRRNMFMTR